METDTELCDRLIERHHIDRLRAIFVSHTHHDHVMDAPYVARKCGATVYGSISAKNVALGGGVPEDKTVVFQHGSDFENFSLADMSLLALCRLETKVQI